MKKIFKQVLAILGINAAISAIVVPVAIIYNTQKNNLSFLKDNINESYNNGFYFDNKYFANLEKAKEYLLYKTEGVNTSSFIGTKVNNVDANTGLVTFDNNNLFKYSDDIILKAAFERLDGKYTIDRQEALNSIINYVGVQSKYYDYRGHFFEEKAEAQFSLEQNEHFLIPYYEIEASDQNYKINPLNENDQKLLKEIAIKEAFSKLQGKNNSSKFDFDVFVGTKKDFQVLNKAKIDEVVFDKNSSFSKNSGFNELKNLFFKDLTENNYDYNNKIYSELFNNIIKIIQDDFFKYMKAKIEESKERIFSLKIKKVLFEALYNNNVYSWNKINEKEKSDKNFQHLDFSRWVFRLGENAEIYGDVSRDNNKHVHKDFKDETESVNELNFNNLNYEEYNEIVEIFSNSEKFHEKFESFYENFIWFPLTTPDPGPAKKALENAIGTLKIGDKEIVIGIDYVGDDVDDAFNDLDNNDLNYVSTIMRANLESSEISSKKIGRRANLEFEINPSIDKSEIDKFAKEYFTDQTISNNKNMLNSKFQILNMLKESTKNVSEEIKNSENSPYNLFLDQFSDEIISSINFNDFSALDNFSIDDVFNTKKNKYDDKYDKEEGLYTSIPSEKIAKKYQDLLIPDLKEWINKKLNNFNEGNLILPSSQTNSQTKLYKNYISIISNFLKNKGDSKNKTFLSEFLLDNVVLQKNDNTLKYFITYNNIPFLEIKNESENREIIKNFVDNLIDSTSSNNSIQYNDNVFENILNISNKVFFPELKKEEEGFEYNISYYSDNQNKYLNLKLSSQNDNQIEYSKNFINLLQENKVDILESVLNENNEQEYGIFQIIGNYKNEALKIKNDESSIANKFLLQDQEKVNNIPILFDKNSNYFEKVKFAQIYRNPSDYNLSFNSDILPYISYTKSEWEGFIKNILKRVEPREVFVIYSLATGQIIETANSIPNGQEYDGFFNSHKNVYENAQNTYVKLKKVNDKVMYYNNDNKNYVAIDNNFISLYSNKLLDTLNNNSNSKKYYNSYGAVLKALEEYIKLNAKFNN